MKKAFFGPNRSDFLGVPNNCCSFETDLLPFINIYIYEPSVNNFWFFILLFLPFSRHVLKKNISKHCIRSILFIEFLNHVDVEPLFFWNHASFKLVTQSSETNYFKRERLPQQKSQETRKMFANKFVLLGMGSWGQ